MPVDLFEQQPTQGPRDLFADMEAPQPAPQAAHQAEPMQAQQEPPSMFERVRAKLRDHVMGGFASAPAQIANIATGKTQRGILFGEGRKEDYPEYYFAQPGVNPEEARTPAGQLEIARKQFPNAALDFDQHGNPIFVPDPQGEEEWMRQPHYFNKPGISMNDPANAMAGVRRYALPVAASAAAAPLSWVKAVPAVGGAGSAGEALFQAAGRGEGSGEDYDGWEIFKAGLFSAAGEGGGRSISYTLEALNNVGSRIMGKAGAKVLTKDGRPTPEFQRALEDKGVGFDELSDMVKRQLQTVPDNLTPEQALRQADFQALGYVDDAAPTRGQVTRNFADQQFEAETAKLADVGAPLRSRQAAQTARTWENVDDLVKGAGGRTTDPVEAYRNLQGTVSGKFKEQGKQVSELYEAARKTKGAQAQVPIDDFRPRVTEALDDFEDVMPAPVARRAKEFMEGERAFTLDEAEKFRKLINKRYKSADPSTRAALDDVRTALDDAVNMLADEADEAAKMFGQARSAASERFRTFLKNKKTGENKTIQAMIDDSLDDVGAFDKAVIKAPLRDLRQTKNILLEDEAGKAAWDDVRATTMRWIADQAKSGSATDEMGQAVFSGANLKRALDKIGRDRLKVMLTADEIGTLDSIARIGEAMTPVRNAVNYSNTSSALANLVDRLEKIPGARYLAGLVKPFAQVSTEAAQKKGVEAALRGAETVSKEAAKAATIATRAQRKLPTAAVAGAQGER